MLSFGNDAAHRGECARQKGIGKGEGLVTDMTAQLLLFDPSCHKWSRGDEEVFWSTEGNIEFWLTLCESATDSAVKDLWKNFPGSCGGGGSAKWSYEATVWGCLALIQWLTSVATMTSVESLVNEWGTAWAKEVVWILQSRLITWKVHQNGLLWTQEVGYPVVVTDRVVLTGELIVGEGEG